MFNLLDSKPVSDNKRKPEKLNIKEKNKHWIRFDSALLFWNINKYTVKFLSLISRKVSIQTMVFMYSIIAIKKDFPYSQRNLHD